MEENLPTIGNKQDVYTLERQVQFLHPRTNQLPHITSLMLKKYRNQIKFLCIYQLMP